jgi:hypothetical protein
LIVLVSRVTPLRMFAMSVPIRSTSGLREFSLLLGTNTTRRVQLDKV